MRIGRAFALRATALTAALLGLAACANPRADQALYAQQAFIGMPKQTLLSCAGVPERQANMDNLEYYTYSSERISTRHVPTPGYWGHWGPRPWSPWYGWSGWGWPATSPEIESQSCEATFTLKNGTVQRVVYGGADGGRGRLGQCYTIVENCLALIPQQQSMQGR